MSEQKITSKYLERYGKSPKKGVLHKDSYLIEVFEEEAQQKTKGGIVIPESEDVRTDFNMLKSTMGIVLEAGAGVELNLPIGAVVWVPPMSLSYTTILPTLQEAIPSKTIARVKEREIIKHWESINEYEQDKEVINGTA